MYKGGYDSDYDSFIPQSKSLYKNKKKKRIYICKSIRKRVFKKYNNECVVCHSKENMTIDHIIPLSKGGLNKENNMQAMCSKCNSEKADKT